MFKKNLLMHSLWLLVVSTSWRTVRDYVANIVDAQSVTVISTWWCTVRYSCEPMLMHRAINMSLYNPFLITPVWSNTLRASF